MVEPDDAERTAGDEDDHDATDSVLLELLAGNEAHVDELPTDYFDAVRDEQHPSVVSICCSDSRVSQEGMWNVSEPGTVFTPSTIGNQVWDDHEGERVVDGSLLYPIAYAGTETIAVVGHTGCGAVTAAYDVATGGDRPESAGVAKWIDALLPVIEAGLASDLVETTDDDPVVDQLVEYNVDAQVDFLRESGEIPATVSIYGFVYDFHGVYGDDAGRTYLVNYDGVTEPEAIAARVPDEYEDAVRSLLY